MARPLMRHTVVELEKMFMAAEGDIKTLKTLEEELKYRNVPRAGLLLDKVQLALRTVQPTPTEVSKTISGPGTSGASPQGALWGEEPERTVSPPVQEAVTQPVNPKIVTIPEGSPTKVTPPKAPTPKVSERKPLEEMTAMSVEEAYKVLKSTPGANWDAIELSRRQLVQQAYPEIVAGLSAERRAKVQADAKLVNAAYAVLVSARLSH